MQWFIPFSHRLVSAFPVQQTLFIHTDTRKTLWRPRVVCSPSVFHRRDGRKQRFIDSEERWMIQASPCLSLCMWRFLAFCCFLSHVCAYRISLFFPLLSIFFFQSHAHYHGNCTTLSSEGLEVVQCEWCETSPLTSEYPKTCKLLIARRESGPVI